MRTAKNLAGMKLSIVRRPTHTLVRLRGEFDAATAPVLHERLLTLLRGGARLIFVDLSEVAFRDDSGLGVLVSGHLHAKALGVTLRLAAPGPGLLRSLRVHGLDRTLEIYPARSDVPARSGTRGGRPWPHVRACQ